MNSPHRSVRNYYELLNLDSACTIQEIKQHFRRQIALVHPDKVQHLAKEIQDLAATRASELTEAYNILSDETRREAYDRLLAVTATETALKKESYAQAKDSSMPQGPNVGNFQYETPDSYFASVDASGEGIEIDRIRSQTAILKLRKAVEEHVPGVQEVRLQGFDVAYVNRPRWHFFKTGPPCSRVLGRLVSQVSPDEVRNALRLAARPGNFPRGGTYVFLMGAGLDPVRKLGGILIDQSLMRGNLDTDVLMVPLNIRTWEVLIPRGSPALLRAIIRSLQMTH